MDKLLLLKNILQEKESIIVAYSGGVDSAVLLAVAQEVLGKKALAVTIHSELSTSDELQRAKAQAKMLNACHLIVQGEELKEPDFVKNTKKRCYFCKKYRFKQLLNLARKQNIRCVVEGSNIDDLDDYRPGSRAVKELGIKSPLQEAGLTKREIRQLAKEYGLSSWNTPSQPCLATRITYGTQITTELLSRIRKAEDFLHSLLGNKHQIRVRDHGDLARLEVDEELISELIHLKYKQTIYEKLTNLGYTYITLDIKGYRQGSMNELLK